MPSRAATRWAAGLGAATVLAGTAAAARRPGIGDPEEWLFRRCNVAGRGLERPMWVVMQAGSLAAVAAAGGALHLAGREHVANLTLASGVAAWVGTKLIKLGVDRGRPSTYLSDVSTRGRPQAGLGYPSGHAAVATTLALVAAPGGVRSAALAVAGLVGVGRVYVGAHLPLDVIGGWATGTLIGVAAGD